MHGSWSWWSHLGFDSGDDNFRNSGKKDKAGQRLQEQPKSDAKTDLSEN